MSEAWNRFPETRRHGPCTLGGTPADKITDAAWWVPDRVRQAVRRRAFFGRVKYGTSLVQGWPHADTGLTQELLDGIVYAVAGRRYVMAAVLAGLSWAMLRACDRDYSASPSPSSL